LINHLYELRDDLFLTVIKLIEGMREIEKKPGPGAKRLITEIEHEIQVKAVNQRLILTSVHA
jgi:hypothetical protein